MFKGQNLAYTRKQWNITHTREVLVTNNIWEIKDELSGQGQHQATLLWHVNNEAEIIEKNNSEIILSLYNNWQMIITGKNLSAEIIDNFESLYCGNKNNSKTLAVKYVFDGNIIFSTIIKKG